MFHCIPEELTVEQMKAISEDIVKLDFIESAYIDENKSLGFTYTREGSWTSAEESKVQLNTIKEIIAKHGGTLEENCI